MHALIKPLIAIISILIAGCSTTQDGSITAGMKGSYMWHKTAPPSEVAAHYDAMPVYKLCILWQRNRDETYVQEAISQSLQRRGENPLKCY
ncbi:MAG: hypothetical protein ACK5SP_02205 [bacterium]|jgi:hypothetical protein